LVELFVAALVVVFVAARVCLAWVIGHRDEGEFITEAQARENTASLRTAILASDRRERKRS
jgi:hypothetical protein